VFSAKNSKLSSRAADDVDAINGQIAESLELRGGSRHSLQLTLPNSMQKPT